MWEWLGATPQPKRTTGWRGRFGERRLLNGGLAVVSLVVVSLVLGRISSPAQSPPDPNDESHFSVVTGLDGRLGPANTNSGAKARGARGTVVEQTLVEPDASARSHRRRRESRARAGGAVLGGVRPEGARGEEDTSRNRLHKAPTTQSPTDAPTTQSPTDAPTTRSPTDAPTTQRPTDAPTTQLPTDAPSTSLTRFSESSLPSNGMRPGQSVGPLSRTIEDPTTGVTPSVRGKIVAQTNRRLAWQIRKYYRSVADFLLPQQRTLWRESLNVFRKSTTTESGASLPESCGELTTASPEIHPSSLVRVIAYHKVFPVQYSRYEHDGADSFTRGNGNQTPDWRDGLFVEVNDMKDADAIVYVASGDESSDTKKSISHDVAIAQQSKLCIPIVFYLASDANYMPTKCTGTRLLFFSPNTTKEATYPNSHCHWYPVPYGAGNALPPDIKYEIPWAEFCPKLEASFARKRPILATFVGSRSTYKGRELLAALNESSQVRILFTDNWWAANTTAEGRSLMATRAGTLLESSVFALCPRGMGPSSMRLAEAIGHGAIPVLLDDWTSPFEDPMSDFALRWPLLDAPGMSLLLNVLEAIAADPKEVRRRQSHLRDFVRQWHPFWYSSAYLRSKLRRRDEECHPDIERARHILPSRSNRTVAVSRNAP